MLSLAAQPAPLRSTAGGAICVTDTKISGCALMRGIHRRSRNRRIVAKKSGLNIAGTLTTGGISSVNALGTPLGRYQKIVADSNWLTVVYVTSNRNVI